MTGHAEAQKVQRAAAAEEARRARIAAAQAKARTAQQRRTVHQVNIALTSRTISCTVDKIWIFRPLHLLTSWQVSSTTTTSLFQLAADRQYCPVMCTGYSRKAAKWCRRVRRIRRGIFIGRVRARKAGKQACQLVR